jgi:hypothetical protein
MLNPALKSVDPDFDAKVRATVPGMAHFARTGPKGKCCGDCTHLWPRLGRGGGYACNKYAQMMPDSPRPDIPRQTPSCKYFEQRPQRSKPNAVGK